MTKKNAALVFIVLFAALGARAQTPAGWVKFSPPEGYFNILVPLEPTLHKQSSDSPHGPYTTHLYMSKTPDGEIYMVGWVDYDPGFNFGVQAELEANRDNFVKNLKATLLSTTPIKLDMNPGIEFKAELPGRADIVSRVYIVGRRPFQLIAVTPAGRDASASVNRFLSSFRLGAK